MKRVKTWAECPVRAEVRGTTAFASFVDNDRMAEAVAAADALVPEQYRASAKRAVFQFDQRVWDYSDVLHTGLAVASWAGK